MTSQLTVTAKKVSFRIFDRDYSSVIPSYEEELADYGAKLGRSSKYGKFTWIDAETNEIMDYGTPAKVDFDGESFGVIIWAEHESMLVIKQYRWSDSYWFDTESGTLDYNF